jgi:hypothetical protein
MPVVDYAPRIACIGVAALQGPVFGSIADLFQPANFGPFVVSPVRAGKWNNGHLGSRPLALLMMGHPHIGAHVDTIEDPLAPLTQIVGRQHLSDRMS